jgi:hypothetical protein
VRALATDPGRTSAASTARAERHSALRLLKPVEFTLEDAILDVWEALTDGGPAECPVCGGEMSPLRCSACGSELS